MNHVNMIGKVSSRPDFFEHNGVKAARFTLCTNETILDANGNPRNITEKHRVMAWGTNLRIVENLCDPGTSIAVEGKLKHRYYSVPGGSRRCVSEVEANELIII